MLVRRSPVRHLMGSFFRTQSIAIAALVLYDTTDVFGSKFRLDVRPFRTLPKVVHGRGRSSVMGRGWHSRLLLSASVMVWMKTSHSCGRPADADAP